MGQEVEMNVDAAVADMATDLGLGEGQEVAATPEAPEPTETVEPEAPAEGAEPVPAEGAAPVEPAAPEEAAAYPKSWKKDFQQHWDKLPAEVRAEINRREKNFLDGTEAYRQEAQVARSFREVFQPYVPTLKEHNVNPLTLVSNLLQVQHTLAFGKPEDKLATVRRIVQDYGVDVTALGGAPVERDAEVESLRNEIRELKSSQSQITSNWLQGERTKVAAEIDSFAKDKPYFAEVADDMTRLIQGGVCSDLKSAYEKAVWANPVTREKEIARVAGEKAKASEEAAKKAAEEAKKQSAANVRTRPKSASPTAKLGSIDDTLNVTYEQIVNRH